MTTVVALEHRTTYRFARSVAIGPHLVRLRPAPHTRTPIRSYSLRVTPAEHFVNWQQDPFGNHVARLVFPEPSAELEVVVGLVADLQVINPFDFFLEPYAANYPFSYPADLAADLEPYLRRTDDGHGPVLQEWLAGLPGTDGSQPVVGFLGALNSAVFGDVAYSVRMETGVQTPDETLTRRIGSCRDSAWLLVAALRHLGIASRFVSGYLVQLGRGNDVPDRLNPDQPASSGSSASAGDVTDLHAWAEAYIPGAGWIGLDATSALFAGEGHIPLSATPHPSSSAPITGAVEPTEVTLEFSNSLRRVAEDRSVTRPYTAGHWQRLDALGRHIDERLAAAGVDLTTGLSCTFVAPGQFAAPGHVGAEPTDVNLPPASSWSALRDSTQDGYARAAELGLAAETLAMDGQRRGTGGGSLTLGGLGVGGAPLLRRPDLLVSLLTFFQHHPSLSYLFAGGPVGPGSAAARVDDSRPDVLGELEIVFAELEQVGAGPDVEQQRAPLIRALRHLLGASTGDAHRSEFGIDGLDGTDAGPAHPGLLQLRGFATAPHPQLASAQVLLVRALVARFAGQPYSAPLVRWGSRLLERFSLPHFLAADLLEVLADLRAHAIDFQLSWLEPFLEFRFPQLGVTWVGEAELELRAAIDASPGLGDSPTGGPSHAFDSSTQRLQVRLDGFIPERQMLACNGVAVPLAATGTPGRFVAGVRYRAVSTPSAGAVGRADAPLHFELVDRVSRLSVGGATYHVVHPGGQVWNMPPVNAAEAESRRASRFETTTGVTPGEIDVDALSEQLAWRARGDMESLTLDLRHRSPKRWGRP